MISQTASAARSWLKVCFLRSAERKVAMEARLEMSPNRPRLEKRTPSHQNSNCFHTWNQIRFFCPGDSALLFHTGFMSKP